MRRESRAAGSTASDDEGGADDVALADLSSVCFGSTGRDL